MWLSLTDRGLWVLLRRTHIVILTLIDFPQISVFPTFSVLGNISAFLNTSSSSQSPLIEDSSVQSLNQRGFYVFSSLRHSQNGKQHKWQSQGIPSLQWSLNLKVQVRSCDCEQSHTLYCVIVVRVSSKDISG